MQKVDIVARTTCETTNPQDSVEQRTTLESLYVECQEQISRLNEENQLVKGMGFNGMLFYFDRGGNLTTWPIFNHNNSSVVLVRDKNDTLGTLELLDIGSFITLNSPEGLGSLSYVRSEIPNLTNQGTLFAPELHGENFDHIDGVGFILEQVTQQTLEKCYTEAGLNFESKKRIAEAMVGCLASLTADQN